MLRIEEVVLLAFGMESVPKESHLSSNRTGSIKSVACPSRALPIA